MSLQAIPLNDAPFGAIIKLPENVSDPSKLSEEDFKLLENALHTYLVIVIPDQQKLSPKSQFELTTMFDDTCSKTSNNYGHGKTFRHENSVLRKDGTTIPNQPQVQVIGNGYWKNHYGLDDFKLTQPSHKTFHKDTLSDDELTNKQTRFYRWHIDSALYELSPPKCTTLLGIHVPNSDEKQKIVYHDSKDELQITKGATAFLSGKTAFDLLSPEDKEFALNSTVVYAPHPYIFISKAKSTSDGITMVSENKERSFDELPEWEESKIKKLPMVWTNPTTGNHHLQFHGSCAYKIINNKTGEEIPMEEARNLLQRFYRPAISPQNIYCHSWNEGDLVIFYNRGVSHSVTGDLLLQRILQQKKSQFKVSSSQFDSSNLISYQRPKRLKMSNELNKRDSSILPFFNQSGPFTDELFEPDADDILSRLSSSKILVLGAGGLGCEILKNLSLSGFKQIHIIDMDTIDISNLNRQFLFRNTDIGEYKAETAANFIKKRIKNVLVTPHNCRIQDKNLDFYKQFSLIICGLDSIEARRWINKTVFSLIDPEDDESIIPIIDGGTEGFRGQTRFIIPTMTSCYECNLDLLGTKKTYPVCTIANTPRIPEHCIEWASLLEWPKYFPDRKYNTDNQDDIDWIYEKALERSKVFNINNITKSLTLGVIKNIIPSIASTNAVVAAACCNEAFKFITDCNPILEYYMSYSGDLEIFAHVFKPEQNQDCSICGSKYERVSVKRWFKLKDLITYLIQKLDLNLENPSLISSDNNKDLYLTFPPQLEEITRINLNKPITELIDDNELLIVTDSNLSKAMKLHVLFDDN
ncbi:NEDD8-activating protein UBA3 ASCRUDRAFT_6993 [Ascoidea rubescens DSM 1968]|uniref:NEDD8-activating enzyme E1 catalytic subunit n=1 Tax=Ascoidea rubescens DSM 1968 TaxID=1344418 RepID=A0A1D2VLF0_9ASCO|nr:hypothetical protein ASCRUDRAFT_6993 [Ascoidea rubescens DSM 1968]ODV62413.1 hypothetical protein ASCRUDRAFT_6993 [Ascoidea rubescens DSM 1968]